MNTIWGWHTTTFGCCISTQNVIHTVGEVWSVPSCSFSSGISILSHWLSILFTVYSVSTFGFKNICLDFNRYIKRQKSNILTVFSQIDKYPTKWTPVKVIKIGMKRYKHVVKNSVVSISI